MRYLPLTDAEQKKILDLCGVKSFEDLKNAIPEELRIKGLLDLPPALTEPDLVEHLESLANKNQGAWMQSHLGQGVYDHTWPTAIDQIINRGEFLTAYTPYQPELSQGTLQAIFEFQSMVCEVLGMEVANASLYDGATSALEAALMAARTRPDNEQVIYVSEGIHTSARKVIESCLADQGFELRTWKADPKTFLCTAASWTGGKDERPAAFILQSPNKWGLVEDWAEVKTLADRQGARSVAYVSHVLSMGAFEAPGHAGVDIAVAEGQTLGIPVGFGGPHLGLFACRRADIRQMPGRLVGLTEDARGQQAFCVTLSTREQHIRREKATSNICSNQNLMAMRALMYLTLMGHAGLQKVAKLSRSGAHYVRSALEKKFPASSDREIRVLGGELFNEVTLLVGPHETLWLEDVMSRTQEQGILAGVVVSVPAESGYVKGLTMAFTERHKKQDLDRLVEILGA
jgi:glycine dehydrogenase subunit 1